MHRTLHGEKHLSTIEVSGERLSEALSEASLVIRDLEQKHSPIMFRLNQQWDADLDVYLLFIHPVS